MKGELSFALTRRRYNQGMGSNNELAKLLVLAGVGLVAMGLWLWSGIGRGWLGRLPGDIHYSRQNFSFHFPVVTCLLASIVLTILLWLFRGK